VERFAMKLPTIADFSTGFKKSELTGAAHFQVEKRL
jgi:hypothetical protein